MNYVCALWQLTMTCPLGGIDDKMFQEINILLRVTIYMNWRARWGKGWCQLFSSVQIKCHRTNVPVGYSSTSQIASCQGPWNSLGCIGAWATLALVELTQTMKWSAGGLHQLALVCSVGPGSSGGACGWWCGVGGGGPGRRAGLAPGAWLQRRRWGWCWAKRTPWYIIPLISMLTTSDPSISPRPSSATRKRKR